MLFEDTWVDTRITAQTQSPCTSLGECGGNRSNTTAYADIIGSKMLMFSGGASSEDTDAKASPPSVGTCEERPLEAYAVRLSLLLKQSCTESGPSRCWRQSGAEAPPISSNARNLRPVTVTFGESHSSRTLLPESTHSQASLVTSLR